MATPPNYESLTEKTAGFVLKYRFAAMAVVATLTLFFAAQLPRLRVNTSMDIWFMKHDPEIVTYNEFRDQFGHDIGFVVGLRHDDVFSRSFLEELSEFVTDAEAVPGVRKVTSLVNIAVPQKNQETDRVEMVPLIGALSDNRSDSSALRERAGSSSLVTQQLLSADGEATAVLITLDADSASQHFEAEVVRAVEAAAHARFTDADIQLAGLPVFNRAMLEYSNRDVMLVGGLAATLVLVASWWMFGDLIVALVPLSVVLLAVIWNLGLMAAFGYELTMLGTPLVMLTIVVGVADAIHVMAAYRRRLTQGDEQRTALSRGLGSVLVPCLFTTLTTTVGFYSMSTSRLVPLQEFGWFSGLGALVAFVLCVVYLVPMLSYLKPPPSTNVAGEQRNLTTKWLERLSHPTVRSSRWVVGLTMLMLIPSLVFISWLTATANVNYYFRPDDPVSIASEAIDEQFGGSATIELQVTTSDRGLTDKGKLRRIEALQEWIESLPGVTRSTSVVDVLKEYQLVTTGEHRLPKSSRIGVVLRQMRRRNPAEFGQLVQQEFSIGRVTANLRWTEVDELVARVPEIERKLASEFGDPTDLHISATGSVKLMARMQEYLISSQIRSLLVAAATITVMMMVLLRSWKLGLLSMIPNLVPIILGLGFMALCDIRLNPGTVMIAGVAMGLVVDDSCHFLTHFRRHLVANVPLRDAIAMTIEETGRPIIMTSLLLTLGFGCLALGSFVPTIHFGVITGLVIVLALAADLILLPAMLVLIAPRATRASRIVSAENSQDDLSMQRCVPGHSPPHMV